MVKMINLRELLDFAAEKCNVDLIDVVGKCRNSSLVKARIVYANLAKRFTSCSLAEIASLLNKDHATIVHYTKKGGKCVAVHGGLIERTCYEFEQRNGGRVEAFTDETMSLSGLLSANKRRLEDERQSSLVTLATVKHVIEQSKEGWLKAKLMPIVDEQIERRRDLLGLRGNLSPKESESLRLLS